MSSRPAPTIDVTVPASNQIFTVGDNVMADYSCADGRTVVICDSETLLGTPIDTSIAGDFVLEVVASDASQNLATVQVAYSVVESTS